MSFLMKKAFVIVLLFICCLLLENEVESTPESDAISNWAVKFGEELWELAETMTKAKEIKQKYKSFNARVERKDGNTLIESIVESIGRMLNRKMDAVKCIVNKSEEYAQVFHRNKLTKKQFKYLSSKFSLINGQNYTNLRKYSKYTTDTKGNYTEMFFDRDSHFFDLEVNTTRSSVHVPTNVYDQSSEVAEFIQWSKVLDDVFKQNYKSDPALSWQYFGSNLGVMRHYPAMSWNRNRTDIYDCRKRSWYIETATCSKDVVILLDNSGSMTGYRNYVAQLTIKSLLDTFSNNDFVNIYNYSKTVQELVPCFKDMLVQATPENIRVFNKKMKGLKPVGNANISLALIKAFKLLKKYRRIRKCSESLSGCNQSIMLITDYVSENATEIFEKYNWHDRSVQSYPVRVFTYLLGREVERSIDIENFACLNRGYHSHINSLDEVAESVLKYVNVIAAPLVLQKELHPPTWTHAYIDSTYETDSKALNDDQPDFRMMIAVGVPAFNLSSYGRGNVTARPELLGVAGTDVPVEDIIKLALPYKLGVNGYSFIVSNNGYVLLHPDLRPFDPKHPGEVKENYNSIDITEIEQIDEDLPPRVTSETLLELRSNLVHHKRGEMLGIPVRFHYDKMRRAAQSKQDFYFAPIPYTPFSLGIALPHDYGNTWIKVGDEIQRNNYTKINISDYFVGDNWKVHPEWVYCKYHYQEGHEFNSSELELRHFLRKIIEPEWKWSQQYEPDPLADQEKEVEERKKNLNCGRKLQDDNAYYCNKELVELLVFDAKVTNDSYRSWEFINNREKEIVDHYAAHVRFVATMSGLTRWQFISDEIDANQDDVNFGNFHSTAINEAWYENAILQHQIDTQSFVYSVPHYEDEKESSETKVSASMAIFPRDGGLEAPGCVVGFQFSHALMYKRFMEMTSNSDCNGCIKTCGEDEQICYVIDNNGYIVISEQSIEDTGRFFGELEKPTMESMLQANIFKRLIIYDLQGLCKNITELKEREVHNVAVGWMAPLRLLFLGLKWTFSEMILELSRIKLWVSSKAMPDYNMQDYSDRVMPMTKAPTEQKKANIISDDDWYLQQKKKKKRNETIFYPCDKKSELYVLQQDFVLQNRGYSQNILINNSRPFHVQKIPNSNLLLIVINKINDITVDASEDILSTKTVEMETGLQYKVEHPCHKLYMNSLTRRRLDECFTEHVDEAKTAYCGKSVINIPTALLLWGLTIVHQIYS